MSFFNPLGGLKYCTHTCVQHLRINTKPGKEINSNQKGMDDITLNPWQFPATGPTSRLRPTGHTYWQYGCSIIYFLLTPCPFLLSCIKLTFLTGKWSKKLFKWKSVWTKVFFLWILSSWTKPACIIMQQP